MSTLPITQTHLRDLIAFPTVSSQSNLDMLAHMAGLLETHGARVTLFHDKTGQKANLWASIGPDEQGGIVLSGHSDVVPVTDQNWSRDPFTLWEEEDRLYGRGTCDMKGFIAACLAMAPVFAQTPLKKPVHFCFTHDEEIGCLGARALMPELQKRDIKPAMAIIGEPTRLRIIEGHKGCCEYTTRFTGLEGHGSAPDRGVNAASFAIRYASRLMELARTLQDNPPAQSRFDPPHTTINIGRINGGSAHNVIPGHAELDWEMRPVQQEDMTFVKSALDAYVSDTLLPEMRAIHPQSAITTQTIGEVVGLEPMEQNEARDLIMQLTGQNDCALVPFGTEAGLFQGLGVHTIVCGPGDIAQAHKPDEYIELSELAACLEMLHGLTHSLTA